MLCRMTYARPDRSQASQTFWAADAEAAWRYARDWEDSHEDHVLLRLQRVASRQALFQPTRRSAASSRATHDEKLRRLKRHFTKEKQG